jgi:hypothetical protein
VKCLAFEALLDEGAPERLPEAALAHARECASCARSLERARALEAALEHHFTALASPAEQAPLVGFTDRVMLRVERGEAKSVRGIALPDALPWWVRAAAEPAIALACAVAALLLWQGPAMLTALRALDGPSGPTPPPWFTTLLQDWGLEAAARALGMAFAPVAGASWPVFVGIALGVAPVLALLGWAMWRAGERLTGLRHSFR